MPKSNASPTVWALIVAAGRGVRAGGALPKQYRRIGRVSVLRRTVQAFASHPEIAAVQVVYQPDDDMLYADAVAGLPKLLAPVAGGDSRQQSVRLGLEACASAAPDLILIHDAARPFVSAALIDRAINAAHTHRAGVPGVPIVDTLAMLSGDNLGEPADRATLRAMQTPQSFDFATILRAHRDVATRDDFTDDAGLLRAAGHPVHVFAGDPDNVKLTTEADFAKAEQRLMSHREVRTGQGYDVHAFGEGDHVWLGGVKIPHDRGVVAHSDGDVVLHAATDAVLGAIADGDIGTHFPPSDPQWKGASSDRFLAHAVALLHQRGGTLTHLDITLVCEAPRIGAHRDAIRARIAAIAGIAINRVAIKATTSEKMGFTGRREGLAALALATVTLPGEP